MRRAAAVVLLSFAALLGLPTSASAGGPTSVLVTNPGEGSAGALYYTDHRYAELQQRLDTGEIVDEPTGAGRSGSSYILTWLIHDVTVWRHDYVYVDVAGGPLVATQLLVDDPTTSEGLTWRRVTEPRALLRLLDGATGPRPASSPPAVEAPADAEAPAGLDAPADVDEPAGATAVRTRWVSLAGWRWMVPGVLAGLVVGLVAVRRRTPPGHEPRRVLLDVDETSRELTRSPGR